MAVTEVGQIFYCEVCGNEVIVTQVGGGELICCKIPMQVGEELDPELETESEEDEE